MRIRSSRFLLLFCCFIGVAFLASTVAAQQRARRTSAIGGYAEGRLMKRNAQELGLSEETLAKIDALLETGKAEEEKIRKESAAAVEKLHEILAQKLPTEKELMSASEKVGALAAKSRTLRMKSVIEVCSLLEPEELEKFMEMRKTATARR